MKNFDKGTVTRTVVLFIAIINQALTLFGKSPLPIDSAQATDIISTAFTVVTALIAWWKNNDFTDAAREGTAHMKRLKTEKAQSK